MPGKLRFIKLFSVFIILSLTGCENLKSHMSKFYHPRDVVTQEKDLVKVVPEKKEEVVKRDVEEEVDVSPDPFLSYLHSARLNLAAYKREKALNYLKLASVKVGEERDFSNDSLNLLKLEFAKKGFASTPTYLILNDGHKEQILKVLKDAKESKQELLSISLVSASNPLKSAVVVSKLSDAIKALDEVNTEAPDYDFATADRAIKDIYNEWKLTPYESGGVVETKYYLHAAKVLADEGYIELAEDILEKAENTYSKSYGKNVFNSKNYDFVSYYKYTSKNIKQTIERDKAHKKRANRKFKGLLDYLF